MTTPAHTRAVAEVLWEHGWQAQTTPRFRCRCGAWEGDLLGPGGHGAHQADALAAAGLLADPAHDARVLRDAANEWQTGGWAESVPPSGGRPALLIGMAQRASDWLRARADRIERQEGA